MSVNTDKIKEALGAVADDDLNVNLASYNGVKSVEADADKIKVSVDLFQPFFKAKGTIEERCRMIVKDLAPGYELELTVNEKEFDKPDRDFLKDVKNIIAISSGKGGVGKSSVTANLAAALSKTGAKVGILDADVYGPSQPTMFGNTGGQLEAVETEDGRTLAVPLEAHGVKIASMGYMMRQDQAAIVRGPMLASYFTMLVEQVRWGELDYLLIDLPPGTGDIQLTMTQKLPLTGALIVTTPQEISVIDVRRSIAMFKKVNVNILGITENMSYFTPPELPDKKYYIFGKDGGKKVAEESDTVFLGEIPLDPAVREAADSGKPVVISAPDSDQAKAFIDLADTTVKEVRKRVHNDFLNPLTKITL